VKCGGVNELKGEGRANWEKNATQQLCAPGMNTGPLGTKLNARKKQSVNLEQMGAAGPSWFTCTLYGVYRENTGLRFCATYLLTLRQYCIFNSHGM
jgi:hypothetical protein